MIKIEVGSKYYDSTCGASVDGIDYDEDTQTVVVKDNTDKRIQTQVKALLREKTYFDEHS